MFKTSGSLNDSSRTVTMSTVAKMAGVTQATVSRAINSPEKVSAKTLSKINQAISLTGYVPNLVAGALASNKSKMIAAVIPSITNIVYAAMLQEFSKQLRKAGFQTIMVESGFSAQEEEALVTSLLSRRPDGILLTGIHHSSDCRRRLLAANIPVVEVWDYTQNPIDICVGFSHIDSAAKVADFSFAKGHTQAAVVSAGDERASRRKSAFCERFKLLTGNDPKRIDFPSAATIRRGREALVELLAQGFSRGLIFCSSDLLAHGVLIEAQRCGLKVPDDFSVVGFGDQDYAADTLPPLTTVKIDRVQLGAEAAGALLNRINGAENIAKKIDVGFEIIERGST